MTCSSYELESETPTLGKLNGGRTFKPRATKIGRRQYDSFSRNEPVDAADADRVHNVNRIQLHNKICTEIQIERVLFQDHYEQSIGENSGIP